MNELTHVLLLLVRARATGQATIMYRSDRNGECRLDVHKCFELIATEDMVSVGLLLREGLWVVPKL